MLKSFVRVYLENLDAVKQVLVENEGCEIDAQKLFNSFTLQTFCEIGFGKKISCIKEDSEFQTAFEKCNEIMMNRWEQDICYLKEFVSLQKNKKVS